MIGINCAYITDGQNLNLAIPIADVDNIRRTANVTLEELYYDSIGGEAVELDTSDWYEGVCIGDNGGTSLYMDMPESIYDILEVNETETGLSGLYTDESGAYELYLQSDVFVGDYSDVTDETMNELADEITAILDEMLEEYGMETMPMTSESGYINDAFWYIFLTDAAGEEWEITPYLLLHVEGDTISYLLLVSILYYDDATETDVDLLDELCINMLSSLLIENS